MTVNRDHKPQVIAQIDPYTGVSRVDLGLSAQEQQELLRAASAVLAPATHEQQENEARETSE